MILQPLLRADTGAAVLLRAHLRPPAGPAATHMNEYMEWRDMDGVSGKLE